jgi:mercuric ion transport protein
MIENKGGDEAPRSAMRGAGAAVFTMGGLGAAFGLASCCGLPFALASLGMGSAWLAGVALFAAPHRPVLLLAAAAGLAVGAVLLAWRRPATACGRDSLFARPAMRVLTASGLLLGFGLLTLGYIYA